MTVSCEGLPDAALASHFGREQIAARDLTPDQEVTLWWEPDDAVLLPDQSPPEKRRARRVHLPKAASPAPACSRRARPERSASTLAGPAFAAPSRLESTTLNWLTWSDHYANDQLQPSKGNRRSRAGRRCSATTPTRT